MKAVADAAPPSATKAVPLAVMLTMVGCGLGVLGYTQILRDHGAASCSCMADADDSLGRQSPRPRYEAMTAALATIAATRSEPEIPAVPAGPAPAKAADDSMNAPEAESPGPGEPRSKEELLAQQKADAHTLDTELAAETADPVWAPKIERVTAEALAKLGGKLHLEDVTCRETLCRVRVTHADPSARDQDVEALLGLPLPAGQAVALSPSGDPRQTALYFSRRSTTLSVLQPPMRMLPPPGVSPDDLKLFGFDSPGTGTPSADVD